MDNLTPEQIQTMIAMLQSMLPKEQPKEEYTTNKPNQITKQRKRKQFDDHSINKFNSMPEKSLHKDDTLIDKKLATQPRVPRARRFNMVKVTCRVCGRSEEVSPGLIQESVDRYKCNKCSTSAG